MKQAQTTITVETQGQGFYDITRDVTDWTDVQSVTTGLLTLFIRHTSASLVIQENADPDVLRDLLNFFRQVAPEGGGYHHDTEGPDDMPAHIRSALTATSLNVPITHGRLVLGTWQGVYLFEHRTHPHRRQIVLHVTGQ